VTFRRFGILFGCVSWGCFQGELKPPVQEEPDSLLQVEGELCLEQEREEDYPVQVLIAVSYGPSIEETDPEGLRFQAIMDLVEAFEDKPHVSFRVFGFNKSLLGVRPSEWDEANESSVFHSDSQRIAEQIREIHEDYPRSNSYSIGVNYDVALRGSLEFWNTSYWLNRSTIQNTRMVTVIIGSGEMEGSSGSDGFNLSVSDFVAFEERMHSSRDVAIHAVQIRRTGDSPVAQLQNMAKLGGGGFHLYDSPEDLDLMDLDFTNEPPDTHLLNLIASNRQVFPTLTGIAVDTDGDGLTDEEERDLGTDVLLSDTDGDGCSDRVERDIGWSPTVSDPDHCHCDSAEDQMDIDGDGLNACEEALVNTEANYPDTDLDGIIDRLEVFAGTFPNLHDSTRDEDHDGVKNGSEIARHRSPEFPDTEETHRFSYRYSMHSIPGELDSRCYRFSVDNIAVLSPEGDAPNENVIEVFAAQAPRAGVGRQMKTQAASLRVPVMASYDEPFRLEIEDFNPLMMR